MPRKSFAAQRTRGESVASDDISLHDMERNLENVVISYQGEFQAAMEKSAQLLREALTAQQSIYEKLSGSVMKNFQPGIQEPTAGAVKPPVVKSVQKAYREANELFRAVEQADHAPAAVLTPEVALPTLDAAADKSAQEALAATAELMAKATEHLNIAMQSVVAAMNTRLAITRAEKPPRPTTKRRKN